MKNAYTPLAILFVLLFSINSVKSQDKIAPRSTQQEIFNPILAPFYHGVASGDPLTDAVIIWTRVTTDTPTAEVHWMVATDTTMNNLIASGSEMTDDSKDYTIKVDVTGLESNTTYYYMFTFEGKNSLIGRTRTAPASNESDHLKMVVVSCQSYEHGYFNAYGRIADRNDIDVVVHLGDYIYEYETGVYGTQSIVDEGRTHDTLETVELAEYRARYSQYRLDPDLIRAHQQQAFINVWDDHESANDAYTDGAENHTDSTEGDWEERKNVARQAFYEWLPIRGIEEEGIIRNIHYGDLADLIMVDTRLEGRNEQIDDVTNPALYSPDRTLLGIEQRKWLMEQLKSSQAQWKVIGNQVIFSELNVGWAADTSIGQTYESVESLFLDIWDGYPVERDLLVTYIDTAAIDNVIWLTGDFHSSFAFDVALRPSVFGWDQAAPTYNAETGQGAVAVEFATPSISSANFDENVGAIAAAGFEYQMNHPLPIDPPLNPNPHMKFVDLDQHGYFLLDLQSDTAQANYYYVSSILEPNPNEAFGAAQYTLNGENHLNPNNKPSAPKEEQEVPAPDLPPGVITSIEKTNAIVEIFSITPNPMDQSQFLTLSFGLNKPGNVQINITSTKGKVLSPLHNAYMGIGHHTLSLSPVFPEAGIYLISIIVDSKEIQTRRLFVK